MGRLPGDVVRVGVGRFVDGAEGLGERGEGEGGRGGVGEGVGVGGVVELVGVANGGGGVGEGGLVACA